MKKLIVCMLLTAVGTALMGQGKITEGVVNFDISYPALSGQMKQMESMLPKAMVMHFKNDRCRMEMNMPSGTMVTLSNANKREMTMLMDMMGKKVAIHQSAKDLSDREAELKKNGQMPVYKVIPSTETKKIAGYTCKKATITTTLDGKTDRLDCFYTEDLPRVTGSADNPAFRQIKGFLMEYHISQNGLNMLIKAKSVKAQACAASLFTIPPDYKVMTQEEVAAMMQKAGGGK